MSFRLYAAAMLAAAVAVLSAGCAAPGPAPSTVSAAFAGKPYVLLGEVHDNAAGQRQRLEALTHAVEQGWRPAIAMEQFDRERQADIDRARRERPRDADYLIAQAGGGAWQWPLYQPVVALALRYDLPLVAANLSRTDAARVVRGGPEALFSMAERQQLGLGDALPPDLVAAQTAVLDRGHCGNFPRAMLPGMLAAQAARDAVMAQAMRPYAGRGAVLIAGNGHVRRDIGVPRWLGGDAAQAVSIGYVENLPGKGEFDMAVVVAAVERKDPCLQAKPAG
ncbi:ChaN family lipoprotein [Cupriavidus necator]|uniref:ChaN family lipoprotein n=1 Tax=Cupriavidus necator TaxID=106590 RepID=UPI002786A69F|nr:ChaN family lipoprotein [Cupriavidus necator]MDQ0143605.1 putative iron-regulated protein [Cupriavidus necator]